MKYFLFCPMEHDIKQAYALAKPHMAENKVVVVAAGRVARIYTTSGKPKASWDTYLVIEKDNGTLDIIDRKIS